MSKPVRCNKCNKTLKWPEWTGEKNRPVEMDGSEHDCPQYQNEQDKPKTESVLETNPDFDKLKKKLHESYKLLVECMNEVNMLSLEKD